MRVEVLLLPGPVCSRQIVLVCLEPLTESGAANSEDNLTACVGTQELALSLTQEGAVAQSPRKPFTRRAFPSSSPLPA